MKLSLKTTPVTWYSREIKSKIKHLKEFVKAIEVEEKHINDMQRSEEIFDDDGKLLTRFDPDNVERNPDWMKIKKNEPTFLGSYGLYSDHLPDMMRYSALIVLYSVFEAELNNLCDNLYRYEYFEQDPQEYVRKCRKGSTIDKFRAYLKNNIDIKNDKNIWESIDRIRLIRNLLVHDNALLKEPSRNAKSKIREDFQALTKFIEKNIENPTYFVIDEINSVQSQVRLTNDFISDAIRIFNEYFELLQEVLAHKYPNS